MQNRKLSVMPILLILIITHIATSGPTAMIKLFGIVSLLIAMFLYSDYLRDDFDIVMLFFVLNHYIATNILGGFFNLGFFIVLIFSHNLRIFKGQSNPLLPFMVIVLFSHFLGIVVKGIVPLNAIIDGTVSLISYLAVLLVISSMPISRKQFGLFLRVSLVMMVLILLSQINSKYAFITINSPLIAYSEVHNMAGRYFRSIVASSPMTAEYAFLNLALSLGLLAFLKNLKKYGISRGTIVVHIVISAIVMILTTNRSTILLSLALLFTVLLINSIKRKHHSLRTWVFVAVAIGAAFTFKEQIGLDFILDRLQLVELESISLESIESGESINRSTAFELGNEMLKRENWLIGYGWSSHYYNRIAWFGSAEQIRADPHSLYYALPMLFGWIGSIAFLMLVCSPTLYGFFRLSRSKNHDSDSKAIGWILLMINMMFLINEIKQGFVVSQNYFFLMMVWIGISVSIQTYGFKPEEQ